MFAVFGEIDMNRSMKSLIITQASILLYSSIGFAGARYHIESGTVLDATTKLIWQKKSTDEIYDWSEAKGFCKMLNAISLGGYSSDWRLPNISELLTIVDYEKVSPLFDTNAFSGPTRWYWTSTPKQNSDNLAWFVNFGSGFTRWESKDNKFHVRCVR